MGGIPMNVRSILCTAAVVFASLFVNGAQSGATAPQRHQHTNNDGSANAYPSQIAAAPDGSLWFGENRGLEHLLPSGRFHLYAVPGAGGAYEDNTPGSLVVDAQGAVWFTAGLHIGRLDNKGMLRLITPPRR